MPGRRAAALSAAALVVGLAGCGSSRPAVGIAVDQPDSLTGTVIDVRVEGLDAGQQVGVAAESRDGGGVRWSAQAQFRADGQGRVDLARDAATGGSYEGVHAMGLFATAQPDGPEQPGPPPERTEITLTVLDGQRPLASRVIVRRGLAPGVSTRALTVAGDGVLGYYYAPSGADRRPAVLAFGGSEGGVNTGVALAQALASRGHPALGIAYFGGPGLPASLTGVPLEYFGRALAFLRAQPGVDPGRVTVLSGSRGSEAAQLLAAHYPVHAVVALSPSDVALCGYPDCARPAWTWQGRAVPFTAERNRPAPTDNPAAVLPYDRIAAPLFLACGERDLVWDSCPYARAAIAHHHAAGDTLLAYPHAGHAVDLLLPGATAAGPRVQGDSPTANEDAREQLWPRVLDALSR